MGNVMSKIFGFLVIAFAAILSPAIYTANQAIWVSANATGHFATMLTVVSFGALIIILGLMFSGGMLAYAGTRGGGGSAGKGEIVKVVLSIVSIVVILSMFPGLIITPFHTLIDAAIAAGDAIGQSIYPFIPLLVYVAVIGAAGWAQTSAYKSYKGKGKKKAGGGLNF